LASWTHRNGGAEHRTVHRALASAPVALWSAGIGSGENRKYRITADPVVLDGRVFTLDSRALVMAHALNGEAVWSHDVTPGSDKSGDASGGGLAVDGDTLFVTTGFGALVALDVATGNERWVQKLEASATGAPTVRDGIVYVSSRDSRAWALDRKTGRIKWQLPGTPSSSVMIGGAGPAVSDKFAVFPFGSGELVAAFRKGGVRTWASSISGKRRGRAYTGVTDITGDPVIVGDVVYVGSQSGRVAALDLGSGERIWTAKEGAYSPVWPVGGSVFLVSDEAKLVRLDAGTGARIWAVDMPYFKRVKPRRRKTVYAHYGPVLAGGRLVVASSDGLIRFFNPVDGTLVSSLEIPGGAASNPVIAGGVLYVVSSRGKLHAFR
jgi:outer membrane protein assembly factor BamB